MVVTQEDPTTNIKKPNIPDACAAENLERTTILELIIRED